MIIAVVQPSSVTESLSASQADYARHAGPGTRIQMRALDPRVPPEADPSDDFIVPDILEQVMAAEADGAKAVIIDCMEDPGVEEARRLVRIPVIGPGQTAMRLAAQLSYRFSILYPLPQVRLMARTVQRHGLTARVASIRTLPCGLEAIRRDREGTIECLVEASIRAVKEDGAHAIIPACTLTSALVQPVMHRLRQAGCPIPVVDGPGSAVKLAEALVATGLAPSHVTYPRPLGIARRPG